MVGGLHFENGYISPTSQPLIIQFRWNLIRRCEFCFIQWYSVF